MPELHEELGAFVPEVARAVVRQKLGTNSPDVGTDVGDRDSGIYEYSRRERCQIDMDFNMVHSFLMADQAQGTRVTCKHLTCRLLLTLHAYNTLSSLFCPSELREET